jgi:RNA polymerase sigma-70 factor (ECF subfamily)
LARDKHAILLELLVLRCKRGERQAFNELISQWEGRLFFYVRRLVATEEDAWDVLQQVWLKVFRGIKTLTNPQRLPTWLYQIARRTAASHWREEYRASACREENADLVAFPAAEEESHFENAEQVHRALDSISLAHREVLTLYFLKDLSLEQMAEVLAVPLGTIKSRLCYAKRAIRASLERREDCP